MFLALKQDIPLNRVVPLQQYNHTVSLANIDDFYLISNVCPHQNSRIINCVTAHLKCPYHGLEFDNQGKGIGHGYSLETQKCFTNQTMLFSQHVDCEFPVPTDNMILTHQRQDIVKATPEIIMDVFLDIDHIPVAHPKVYDSIGISSTKDLQWSLFANGSVQIVPAQDNTHIIEDDQKYNLGAAWMAVYPGTMIEWQPGALFVTVAQQHATGSCVNIYQYQDSRYPQSSWDVNQTVWEKAWQQDKELSEMIVDVPYDNIDELKQHHRIWMQNAV